MEFPDARLLVLAKAPVPGQVKTRLAATLGARRSADVHKALVHRTLTIVTAAQLCQVQLWCAPDTKHHFFLACRRDYGLALRKQQGADLGQRMYHAIRTALTESSYAVLIGSDCGSLDIAALRFALTCLAAGRDAVLGPAEDGGYVLIGLRRAYAEIFRGITWGKSTVLVATRRRLQRISLDWRELATGWDVDQPADMRRLKRGQNYVLAMSASPKDSVV